MKMIPFQLTFFQVEKSPKQGRKDGGSESIHFDAPC